MPPRKTLTLKSPPIETAEIRTIELNGTDPKPRKIAIVGQYPETCGLAPFGDPSWEIWSFSRGSWKNGTVKRWNKWFELHNPQKYRRWENEGSWKGYQEFLKRPRVIELKDFPRQALLDRFGPWFFQTGQAPWIMAYAITQEPAKIGIWGIECKDQYRPQRLEMQHFIQLARDQGIEVEVPKGCSLLETTRIYE